MHWYVSVLYCIVLYCVCEGVKGRGNIGSKIWCYWTDYARTVKLNKKWRSISRAIHIYTHNTTSPRSHQRLHTHVHTANYKQHIEIHFHKAHSKDSPTWLTDNTNNSKEAVDFGLGKICLFNIGTSSHITVVIIITTVENHVLGTTLTKTLSVVLSPTPHSLTSGLKIWERWRVNFIFREPSSWAFFPLTPSRRYCMCAKYVWKRGMI